jgi:hypothetical protein
MSPKKAIKWVNALDSVLVSKTKGNEPGKSKIAAFDLVNMNMYAFFSIDTE